MLPLLLTYLLVTDLIGASLLATAEPEIPHENPGILRLAAPVDVASAPIATEKAPALSPSEHLRAAIEHLRAAGYEDDAERIQLQAEKLQAARLAELREKRDQLEQLQCQISRLEQELGVANQYMLECIAGEVDIEKMTQLGMDWNSLLPSENEESGTGKASEPSRTVNADQFQAAVRALASEGTIKILANPVLVTTAGRPATIRSGGEFPVIIPPSGRNQFGSVVPAAGQTYRAEFREFGQRLEAIIVPLGEERVRIDFAAKISERDDRHAVNIGRQKIPGLTVRGMDTQIEMNLDETQVLSMAGKETTFFVAVTPRRVNRPAPIPIPEESQLRPIPEDAARIPLRPSRLEQSAKLTPIPEHGGIIR